MNSGVGTTGLWWKLPWPGWKASVQCGTIDYKLGGNQKKVLIGDDWGNWVAFFDTEDGKDRCLHQANLSRDGVHWPMAGHLDGRQRLCWLWNPSQHQQEISTFRPWEGRVEENRRWRYSSWRAAKLDCNVTATGAWAKRCGIGKVAVALRTGPNVLVRILSLFVLPL